jgi:hypothetical protein
VRGLVAPLPAARRAFGDARVNDKHDGVGLSLQSVSA